MKKYSLLLFTLFASSVTFAQVTMDEFKKQFKDKSMAEVKAILVDQNKQLANLLKLSSLSLKITPGKPDPNEVKITEKFSTAPKDKIIKNFNERLNNIPFRQKIIYPNTDLGLDYSSDRLIYSVNDYKDYDFPKPTLKLKKIYFKDGKTTNLNQNIVGRDEEIYDEIKGTKWIDSVALEASYYYPEDMSYVNLSTKNPSQIIKGGKLILTEIKGNEIDLQLSEPLKEQIIKVEGINASGKSVEQSGSSSSSMNTNYSPAFLTALHQAGEDAIVKIDANQYKNVDDLIQDLYQKMPKEDKEKPENLTNASYSFRGNITSVNIFFKPKGAVHYYNFTLKNEAEYVDGFAIAQNKKGLLGLLDENGKWAIEPTMKRLQTYKGNYFLSDVGEDGYQSILWLDKINKKLVPFKYRFYHSESYFDKYYFIENGVNGPKGLLDMHTNKVLIEPIYDNINSKGNFIILSTTDKRYKILDKNLKEILLLNRHYKIHDDFIFVEVPYQSNEKFADYISLNNTSDIYNKLGEKINKEAYVIDTYDFFGKDELLLVKNKSGKKTFINTKGEVVLDATKYADVEHFSNGLAPVKNQNGKWGYMNTKGEVVIPFMYKYAKNFSKISALVETEDTYMLIDPNNKIIKTFEEGFSSYQVIKDAENLEYRNYNKKTYNSKGQVVKE